MEQAQRAARADAKEERNMDFDQKTAEGRDYARVYPTMGGELGNRNLRTAAVEAGNKDMVGWAKPDGQDIEWRLYKDQVPAGLDVDKAFGKFATEAAREASLAETAAFKERQSMAAGVTRAPRGQEIPEGDRMYPNTALKADFDRDVAIAKKNGTDVKYDGQAGAWYVSQGEKVGWDKYKTPEAKAQWEAEATLTQAQRRGMARDADRVIDATAERAAGRHFVADNAAGYKLPDPTASREAKKLFDSQGKALKEASDVDVSRIHVRTKDAAMELRDKMTQIRLNKALDLHAHEGLTPKEFYEAGRYQQGDKSRYEGEKRQRQMAGGAGLGPTEFAQLVALERGYSAIRKEAVDRGLIADRSRGQGEAAERQQEQAPRQERQAPQQEQAPAKQLETADAGAPAGDAAPEGRKRARGNRSWAAAMDQSVGR
jgi:hypothetical protein